MIDFCGLCFWYVNHPFGSDNCIEYTKEFLLNKPNTAKNNMIYVLYFVTDWPEINDMNSNKKF